MASLTPDTASTSTSGTTVVNQASEEIWGISCRKKRSKLRNFLPVHQMGTKHCSLWKLQIIFFYVIWMLNKNRNAALSLSDPTMVGQLRNPCFSYKTSCNLGYKHGAVRKCSGCSFLLTVTLGLQSPQWIPLETLTWASLLWGTQSYLSKACCAEAANASGFCFSNSSHFAEVNFMAINNTQLLPGLTLLFQD